MNDEDKEKLKQNLIIAQYNRASYDFRMFDQLMWQVPSVSITITSVVFAAAFGFIRNNYMIMGVVLILGGIFDFTLLIALTKYRLMQDVRARWMEDIENELGIKNIPVYSKDAEEYLSKKHHDHKSPKWFRKRNAFRSLFYTILILFTVSVLIGVYLIYLYFTIY
jgi:hypothetical protein